MSTWFSVDPWLIGVLVASALLLTILFQAAVVLTGALIKVPVQPALERRRVTLGFNMVALAAIGFLTWAG